MDPWFVYIAQCADGTLYVGIARDVAERIAVHDSGRGARYTRGRGPLRLLTTRKCASKGDALRLELSLKRLTRLDKLAIAGSPRKLARLARLAASRPVADRPHREPLPSSPGSMIPRGDGERAAPRSSKTTKRQRREEEHGT